MLLRSESKLPMWWVVLEVWMEAVVAAEPLPPSGSRPSSSHK